MYINGVNVAIMVYPTIKYVNELFINDFKIPPNRSIPQPSIMAFRKPNLSVIYEAIGLTNEAIIRKLIAI